MTVGGVGDHPLAPQSPPAKPRQVGRSPSFVEEDQPVRVEPDLLRPPRCATLGNVGPVLFTGAERFFLKVMRKASSAIQMAVTEH